MKNAEPFEVKVILQDLLLAGMEKKTYKERKMIDLVAELLYTIFRKCTARFSDAACKSPSYL